jgi:hypothetical protein
MRCTRRLDYPSRSCNGRKSQFTAAPLQSLCEPSLRPKISRHYSSGLRQVQWRHHEGEQPARTCKRLPFHSSERLLARTISGNESEPAIAVMKSRRPFFSLRGLSISRCRTPELARIGSRTSGAPRQKSELTISGQAKRASHATSAPARAYSVVRAGTGRIRPSAFFASTPATECSETNRSTSSSVART